MYLDAINGILTVTLKSWGDARFTVNLHAANGVLIGVGHDKQPVTVVLSVSRQERDIIR